MSVVTKSSRCSARAALASPIEPRMLSSIARSRSRSTCPVCSPCAGARQSWFRDPRRQRKTFVGASANSLMKVELWRGLGARLPSCACMTFWSGTLDVKAVNGLFWPLLDGLARVHATGFLHRDIKPANILVDADGCPTLIDFGASRAAIIGHSASMTAIFTPGYAAIEQYTSSSQGPWTDIYGLSATVHHAIVGHPPPPAVARILEDAYRPLVALRPAGFDQSFLAGIDAGLSIRASQRPQSIDRWRELLQTRPSDQETADTVHLGRLSRLRRPDRSRAQSRSPPRLLLGALA